MIFSTKIHLSRDEWLGIPSAVRERIASSLTYSNPKFAMTKRLGFSVFGIPKELTTFNINDKGFSAMRGEFQKILNALHDIPIPVKLRVEDNTTDVPFETPVQYKNDDFELDERQTRCLIATDELRQGIIHAATSAGKSAIIMALVHRKQQKTLIIVPRKTLLLQLKRDAEKWLHGCTVGTVMGGKAEWGDVTFALERSLKKHLNDARNRFGMVILDEAHVAAANTFQDVVNAFPAKFRYGFTGTIKRKDGMQFLIYATFGRILAEVTADELLEAGRISPVTPVIHTTTLTLAPEIFDLPAVEFWSHADKAAHESLGRLLQVKDIVLKIREERPKARITIASRYLDPLHKLFEELESVEGLRVGFVTGEEKDQDKNCQMLDAGELDVLLATLGCFSTGVNIPSLTDIILISPLFTNELLIKQLRGRLMRKSEGKSIGYLHFLWDENIFDPRKLKRFLSILRS